MNRILTVVLISGGLLLLDAPEAAAHSAVRTVSLPSLHHHYETQRARKMPAWLKQNRSFRTWYRHSQLRRNRFVSWHQLFRVYRWERVYRMNHKRVYRHAYKDGFYRRDRRPEKRNKRRRRS